jgi:hypothetical protein
MSKYTHCAKCCTSRSGEKLGEACKTPGCDGVITEVPDFKDLVDSLPEEFLCPRRTENPDPNNVFKFPKSDHWDKFKTNGQRVCSYCGSLHPDDMFALVRESAEAPADGDYLKTVTIEPSDKKYKVYVHQPGVRNAHEGGIKFYMMHLPRKDGKIDVTDQQQAEYADAVKRSDSRFNIYLKNRYPAGEKS